MPKIVKQTMKKVVRRNTRDVLQSAWPDETDGIKINIYGHSGTGKTTLWSTFPKPILAIICSGSRRPGELRSINTSTNRKAITAYAVRNSVDVSRALEEAHEGKFATCIVDHISGVQDMKLREILNLEELPAQMGWGVASQQEWGQCALQVKETLREVLSLPCNVVLVAQERVFKASEDGGDLDSIIQPHIAAALSPSIVGWLNPACDYICQTFIRPKMIEKTVKLGKKVIKKMSRGKGVEYCLRTGPDETYTTKFRIPRGSGIELPDVIVDPTYDKIYALINGG